LFTDIDVDGSGTLDLEELRDIVKEVDGNFKEETFMSFFQGKTHDDTLSCGEFGYYVAHLAQKRDAVPGIIEKMTEARVKVHLQYEYERKIGQRK
jgi:hypothetical protein